MALPIDIKHSEHYRYYDLLGVDNTATDHEIRRAYRRLALQYHPDKNSDTEANEKLKEITVAYSVLSDPEKRRQYDLAGDSDDDSDQTGFSLDVEQLSTFLRLIAAFLTYLGVPIPTAISTKCKSIADGICNDEQLSVNCDVQEITPGYSITSSVPIQNAKFYRLTVSENDSRTGVIICCRSPNKSRLKLILFDSDGEIRQIEDSLNLAKCTAADMHFVPYDRLEFSNSREWNLFYQQERKTDPYLGVKLLTTVKHGPSTLLQPGAHLFGVYGDNWFQEVPYTLTVLLAGSHTARQELREYENLLEIKCSTVHRLAETVVSGDMSDQEMMHQFARQSTEILDLLDNRAKAYEMYLTASVHNFPDCLIELPLEDDSL